MAIYKVKRNGKEYVYNYDRSQYGNNSKKYNEEYWNMHKEEISRKAKLKRIQKRIEKLLEQ